MKATHNVKAYRNNMDSTSGRAPFLGTYISHETVPLSALCEQVAAQSGLTAIQARAMIEGSFDAIADLEKDGLVIVHLDGMSVWAVITGSFPTGDAEFDPERNALNLAIRLDDPVRLAIVNTTAQMVTDSDLTKVRLDNVKDVAVERPMNLIHGRHVFRAAGYNLVLDDEGSCVYLKDRNGVRHEVTVDEKHSNQLFTAHTAELLDGGDYTLWVESKGGDAEGPLQKDKCKVKYLRVEDPAPEPIGQSEDGTVQVFSMTDQTGAEILTAGNNWRIDGLGLAPEGFTTEGWVLNSVRLEANGIDAEAQIVEGDSDKKHVVVRAESDIANPGDYEVTFHFDLQEYGSIESESFNFTQLIRVPQGA